MMPTIPFGCSLPFLVDVWLFNLGTKPSNQGPHKGKLETLEEVLYNWGGINSEVIFKIFNNWLSLHTNQSEETLVLEQGSRCPCWAGSWRSLAEYWGWAQNSGRGSWRPWVLNNFLMASMKIFQYFYNQYGWNTVYQFHISPGYIYHFLPLCWGYLLNIPFAIMKSPKRITEKSFPILRLG